MISQTTSPIIELLTDQQVSRISGVTPKTLANWRCKGVGPVFCKVGHHIRYRPEDVNAFLNSRVFCSTGEYAAHQAAEKLSREV